MDNADAPRFGRQAGQTLFTYMIDFAFAAILSILILRLLGPEDAGRYALWVVIPETLARLVGLGVSTGNTYFAARHPDKLPALVGNSLLLAAVLTVAAGLLLGGYVSLGGETGLDAPLSVAPLALLLVSASALMLAEYFRQIMLGLGAVGWFNILFALTNALRVAALIVFVVVMRAGLTGALLAWALAMVVSAAASIGAVLRRAGRKARLDSALLCQTLRFSAKSYVASTATYLTLRLDVYLLTALVSFEQVGFYKAATSLTDRLWTLGGSVAILLFARVAATRDERHRRLTPVVARLTLLWAAGASLLLFAVGPVLIALLFTDTYSPAFTPMALLLPGAVAFTFGQVLNGDIAGRGRPGTNAVNAIVALTVNVIANLILIPRYGIAGAALSSSISYSLRAFLALAVYTRLASVPWREVLVPRAGDWLLVRDSLTQLWLRARSVAR